MDFHVINKGITAAPESATYPCCTLEVDDWDDYGHKILYHLSYYTRNRQKQGIGDVKILHSSDAQETPLGKFFKSLDANYCSLGQSVSYYQELSKLSRGANNAILQGLRDLTQYPPSRAILVS